MLMVISPAKTLDYDTPPTTQRFTLPEHLDHAQALISQLRDMSPQQIGELMHLSDKLAALNVARYGSWDADFTPGNAKQALLAFKGDVYTGLDANELTEEDLDFAQDHLRMLSGLSGVLRPLDLMQPCRLEMGTKLANPRGKDLYAFWGERISEWLNEALAAQGCDVIFSNAQDTPSVVSKAEEIGIYSFNLNSSMKAYAPKTYLGCVLTDWSPFFRASIEAHLAGNFKGANAFLGVGDDVVKVVDWSPDIPADVVAQIKEVEAAIADGSFSPFTGPIMKADGSEGVAAGVTMTNEEVIGMDWHVKGVTTPLPG